MKSMVRKTKNDSGATIIMALLFTLVCVMVSSLLLATAGTVSRDVRGQREQQQAYLAVSSAIDLLRNDIENCQFSDNNPNSVDDRRTDIDASEKAAFIPLLQTAMNGVKQEGKSFPVPAFTLRCENMPDVQVDFTMNKNCGIVVTCTAYKDEAKTTVDYRMTAKFKTDRIDNDNSTWVLSSVSKG